MPADSDSTKSLNDVQSEPVEGGIVKVAPVGREARVWEPTDTGYYSRNEMRRQRGGYESIISARLDDWHPRISNVLAADIEDASRALADFDSHAVKTLGIDASAIGPMAAILLRTESASSSQIENLTTSARQLALAEIDETDKPNALTVVGNVRAMEAAMMLSDRIDIETVLAMHRELLQHQQGFEKHAGQFRDELVWIGRDNAGPIGADFIAPQHERVPEAVQAIIEFASRDDLPVLMQVAVAHAQFETVHPFVDGNGRTGRALAQAMLRSKGLVTHITVPISAGLLTDLESYFDALNAFRDGDAGPIVRRFAGASRFAAVTGRALVDALATQLQESREKLVGVRTHAAAWKILPHLIGQPIVNSRYMTTRLSLNAVTAQRTLDLLTERGVLRERTGLRRNRVWQHTGILDTLDDYAENIRRAR